MGFVLTISGQGIILAKLVKNGNPYFTTWLRLDKYWLILKEDKPMEDNFKDRISKYTLRELLDVETSLDKDKSPDKYALLKDEILLRRRAGEYVPQAYACPSCKKLTISHCDKQNSRGTIKCPECGDTLYLDPNRSSISTLIGFIGFVLTALYESCWHIIIALFIMLFLRDKWITFVSNDMYTYRQHAVAVISYMVYAVISLLLALSFEFSDPSWVGPYRLELISFCVVSTIVFIGYSLHSYKKLKRLKN